MDYARQQRDPTKHAIGIVFVVGMHLLLIWALLSGLGKAVIEVIKKPLSATIVEEIKAPPPPPPPPKKIVEMPKQPVETYVPPPDIPVQTTQAPVITAVTPAPPPPEPYVIAPAVVAPPAPPAPKPAIRKNPKRTSGADLEYPRAAIRSGIEKGMVIARVLIDEKGNVTDVVILQSDPPKVFDRVVIDGVKEWKYSAEGDKYVAEIEVVFQLK
jgi:periplasmic protein TonB